jgi:WD40 repeat protein
MKDTDTAQNQWSVQALAGRISALSFSSDGETLVAAGAGGEAAIFQSRDGTLLRRLAEHGSDINDISFNPTGTRIATASYDASVGIWDPATGHALCSLKGHSSRVWQAQWSPDGKRIASSSSGIPGVRVWEPMDVSQTTSTAAWAGELRAWQKARFAQRIAAANQVAPATVAPPAAQ